VLPSRDEVGDLAGAYNQINDVLVEARVLRTRIQTVLDNTGDGLITCDLSGRVADAISHSAAVWFGPAQAGVTEVESYLFAEPRNGENFRLGLMQIVDDMLPFELLVDQLPATLYRDGREFRLSYQPIFDDHKLTRLLIVVRDVTDELVAQRAQHEAEDVRAILANILRDREGFALLRREVESLLQLLTQPDGDVETRTVGSSVTCNRSPRSARTECGAAEPGGCQVFPGRVGHRDDRASSVQGDTHDKSLGQQWHCRREPSNEPQLPGNRSNGRLQRWQHVGPDAKPPR